MRCRIATLLRTVCLSGAAASLIDPDGLRAMDAGDVGAEPGATDASAADPPPPLSLEELAVLVAQRIHPDGTTQRRQLAGLLADIRARLDPVLGLPGAVGTTRDAPPDPFAAATADAAAGGGWHLWAFWSVDSPASAGLAAALTAALAAHPLAVHVVHVAGIRQWEVWLAGQSAAREELIAAARRQDAAACHAISMRWRQRNAALAEMVASFYPGGVAAWAQLQPAIALRVDRVPCFRLLSPRHVVHALDGFAAGYDLSAWITRVQDWEAAHASELP